MGHSGHESSIRSGGPDDAKWAGHARHPVGLQDEVRALVFRDRAEKQEAPAPPPGKPRRDSVGHDLHATEALRLRLSR